MSSFEQRDFTDEAKVGQAETHTIETPEQVGLEYSVAGVGSRFVAALLDSLILVAFFFAEMMVMVMIAAASSVSPRPEVGRRPRGSGFSRLWCSSTSRLFGDTLRCLRLTGMGRRRVSAR